MKLNKIILALAAVAVSATACQKEGDTLLSEIQISSSYVTIPLAGGTTKVNLKVSDAWTITCHDTCSTFKQVHPTLDKDKKVVNDTTYNWLSINKTTGEAGEHVIEFSAKATQVPHQANLYIKCAGKEQKIIVMQGLSKPEPATCAQVLAGPNSKTYQVSGTVTGIANTQYGNLYINDGTGEVYVYGTLDKDGKEKNFLSLGIEVGDIITVEGPKDTYNGTVELVNVTVIKIVKSLIKVEKVLPTSSVDKEGGNAEVWVTFKGKGLDISEIEAPWLTITGQMMVGDTTVVLLRAAANEGFPRTAEVKVSSSSGSQTSEAVATVKQAGLTNTCAEILALPKNTGTCTNDVIVTCVYGKGFFIHDDTGDALVYVNAAPTVALGDKVVVEGTISQYSGMNQIASPVIEKKASKVSYTLTPVTATAADLNNWVATPTCKYAKISGITFTANKDYEGKIAGSDAKININYDTKVNKPSQGATNVELEGYVYGSYNGTVYFYATKAAVAN